MPELLIAIEFDGIQHFEPCKKFDSKTYTLAIRQQRDRLKDFYCRTKGIDVVRIHYKDIHKISNILDELII